MARSLLLEATSSVRRFLLARASRRRKLIIEVFVAYFFLLPIVLFLLLGHIFPTTSLTFPPKLWESRHALVVVAHPDDEALFFNPAILAMTTRRDGVGDVGLVVISSGMLLPWSKITDNATGTKVGQETTMDLGRCARQRSRTLATLLTSLKIAARSWTSRSCKTTQRSGGQANHFRISSRSMSRNGRLIRWVFFIL